MALFLAAFVKYQIKLGLDLQGGMHLVLDVEAQEALKNTVEKYSVELKDTLDSREIDYETLQMDGANRLLVRLLDAKQLPKLREIVGEYEVFEEAGQKDSQVTFVLRKKAAEEIQHNAIEQALEIIRNRVDQFGVAEPVIQRAGSNRIVVQLPGIDNPERAINLIGKTALLEFKLVDEEQDLQKALEGQLPPDGEILYEKETDRETGKVIKTTPYLLKKRALMTGDVITSAQVNIDPQYNEPYVTMSFNSRGGKLFSRITGENVGKQLAIILDNNIYSAPTIQEKIPHGRAQITGRFTMDEARDLAIVLRSGALPAPIQIQESRIVGPSLGQDSIRQGVTASILGGLLVVGFMILYYGGSGLIANLALILNIVILLGALSYFRATLTLPGIAGIILTVGMAVDANVLIFERIREELRTGQTVRAAIDNGFTRAWLTIFDANVTTIIAAVILYLIGTGPVRGFAITLSLGILISMFTAVFVARVIFDLRLSQRKLERLSIGISLPGSSRL
ncbi:MAG: protein translocase subunit SecD [Nitrospinae bacterium]|nr:protein translocase subunit SecD [Nitrospinota bacterium]